MTNFIGTESVLSNGSRSYDPGDNARNRRKNLQYFIRENDFPTVLQALKRKLSEEEKEYLCERMEWDKNWLNRRRERYPNGSTVST